MDGGTHSPCRCVDPGLAAVCRPRRRGAFAFIPLRQQLRSGLCGAGCVHAQYKAYAYVRTENLAEGWSRDRIVHETNALGVPCYQGSCSEVYLEKAFDNTGWRPEPRLPVAKALGETSLMWLVHPTLTADEMARTAAVVAQVLQQASKA